MIDTLSNSVLQNVPYNIVPYKFHTSCHYSGSTRFSHMSRNIIKCHSGSVSGKKVSWRSQDILEGPEYKVQSVPYNTKSDVPYNTMTCLLPSADETCHDDALTNHFLPCNIFRSLGKTLHRLFDLKIYQKIYLAVCVPYNTNTYALISRTICATIHIFFWYYFGL